MFCPQYWTGYVEGTRLDLNRFRDPNSGINYLYSLDKMEGNAAIAH